MDLRGPRNPTDIHIPYAAFVEEECGPDGEIESVATVFLTNRECPFRCTMCDLWRNTRLETVPVGAIPQQIDKALRQLEPATTIKLYNSGSFFDPRAIPPEDYKAIASMVSGFKRVIVECHPALVGHRCIEFQDLLNGRLEVAIGLETAHEEVLEKLNKRMTLEQFAAACNFLQTHSINVRAFILVQPPFMKPQESLHWAQRSLDFAFNCDVTAASLIPTRGGNGAMEALSSSGNFVPPDFEVLENAVAYGLGLGRGRVFADFWDLKRENECSACFDARVDRLRQMNLRQSVLDRVACNTCRREPGGAP